MSFWSSLVGWGANSRFEKHRLLFTNKNDMAPLNQSSLKKMMITFLGQDEETRAEIGLAIILRKINDSDSNNSWVYLLKNLIILDSALEQNLFTQQLSQVDMPTIYNFKVVEKNYVQYNVDTLIKRYLKLIKFKASIMEVKTSIFKTPLYKRQQMVQNLNVYQTNWHLDQCEQLFAEIFDIIQYKQNNIIQFEVVKYLFFMLKNKLIAAYSIEMLCISHYLSLLQTLNEAQIQVFKKRLVKFNTNAGLTISFFEQFKDLKGFENLNYKQFNFNLKQVVAYADQVIKLMNSKDQKPKNIRVQQLVTDEKLTIIKKINNITSGKPTARMIFVPEKIPKKQVFQTYFNMYSQDFPPKQLMSQQIAKVLKQKDDTNSDDEQALALERSNVLSVYNILPIGQSGTESKNVGLQYRNITPSKYEFKNIYSRLQSKWVS